jgi:hypothetical protein
MTNVRNKGHRYELQIVKELEEVGYDKLSSTRAESRNLDNAGVDITSTIESEKKLDFHPQCKSLSTRVAYELLFGTFRLKLPLVIFHKFTKKANKNFISQGEYVILQKDYFYKLLKNQNAGSVNQ